MTVVTGTEVLEPGQRTLLELADAANREHALVMQAGSAMVAHAIAAGEFLTQARAQCELGRWMGWVNQNLEIRPATAGMYMRLARYQEQIKDARTIAEARRYLTSTEAPRGPNGFFQHPEWLKDDARRLRQEGATYPAIAQALGVARSQVYAWCNPKRHNEMVRRNARKKRAIARALREQEREAAIKRAVKKAGSATQEAWAMAERMQDVLAQAQRETEAREAKRALSEAGVHYRKMRDEIVRALGVA